MINNGDEDDKLDNRDTVEDGYLLFKLDGFPRTSSDGFATRSVVF